METYFGRAARATALSSAQLELIVGSLLGDGTLLRTTAGYCFRVHHSLVQRPLVDWKYEQLRSFVRSAPRTSGAGYYFRTVSHPVFERLRSAFYVEKRKVVPLGVVRKYLTPLALAAWIMDDGAADGFQLRINTQCFSMAECATLVALLSDEFNLRFTVNMDKERPRLGCVLGRV